MPTPSVDPALSGAVLSPDSARGAHSADGVAGATAATGGFVSSGKRLDRLPISGFHWKMLGLIGGGALIDAFDVYLAAGVLPALNRSGFSTLAQNAAFLSATFIGMCIGAGFAGYIGDRFGRRASYQFNLMLFGGCALLAAFAPNIEVLIGLRFLMGIGLGAEIVVSSGTLGEFIPAAYRGRWAALLSLIISAGLPIASAVGYFVIPTFGWRYMFGIAGVAAVIVWAMRKRMPESPRWLESVGRHDEAEATLTAIEADVIRQHGSLPPIPRTQDLHVESAPFSELFNRARIGRVVLASLVAIAVNIAIYGFIVWVPSFFVKQGMEVAKSLAFTTLITVGALAGPLLAIVISDRISRSRGLFVTSFIVIVLGVVFAHTSAPVAICVTGFALVTAVYFMVALGLYGFIPELFETRYRLRGAGVAGMLSRGASIGTPFATVALFTNFGINGVVVAMSAVLVVLMIALKVVNVQTSGSSLEAI